MAALQCLQHGHAAAARSNEPIQIDAKSGAYKQNSVTFSEPVITQGSTLLRALKGEGNSPDGDYENTTWKFTGNVHLEFDGAVVDAQAATAVFVKGKLSSVIVQAGAQQPKKPVHAVFRTATLDVDNATVALADGRIKTIQGTGTPAQFSFQPKKSGRRVNGRAGKIDYDVVKDSIRFSEDTWYTDGRNVSTGPWMIYNFTDDTSETGQMLLTVPKSEDHVPSPRTPDRTTAQ